MTAKYGIPYFSNFVNSDMSPEDARSMCCRLRLDNRELLKRGGGLFGANPLTGSIGVVTINLPRIGYQAKNEREFYTILDQRVRIAVDSLLIKRKVLEKFTEKNLYPYSRYYLREIKQGTGYYWKNHFSTVGIIGMNEACLNFLKKDIGTVEGQAFALAVMDHLRNLLAEVQDESGDIFNLEATPAEGTSFRLAMLDKKSHNSIRCANEVEYQKGAAPYYTNSTQLPVNYTDDLYQTLQLQDRLQTKYTGGTVLHIFLGEQLNDITSVKGLIRKIANSYRLPYFTLTPTFSVCQSHGYLPGEQPRCARCNQETEIYSRVVGYLRPIKQWNDGKQAEFAMRKTYRLNSIDPGVSAAMVVNPAVSPKKESAPVAQTHQEEETEKLLRERACS
jgi:ribonucleoside-triphosphate reductase